MNLVTKTDLDNQWLRYTLDIIKDTSGLKEDITLSSPDDIGSDTRAIWYGILPPDPKTPYIPRRTHYTPNRMVLTHLEISEKKQPQEILIYKDTLDDHKPLRDIFFDILFNIFAYVSCVEEYEHEKRHSPIHSYAWQLWGDSKRFDRPYANLLIEGFCEWVRKAWPNALPARERKTVIHLTHDIDAVHKALRIRIKQGAVQGINACRSLAKGRLKKTAAHLAGGSRFLFGRDHYWHLDAICRLEAQHEIRSTLHVFAGVPVRGLGRQSKRIFFDPPYNIFKHNVLRETLRKRHAEGWRIGLHQSFDAWQDADLMKAERNRLEDALGGIAVTCCRQHWLRFSLMHTWQAQHEAGFEMDGTLGFNDRPGFRAGLASAFYPYDHANNKAHSIRTVPLVLMDAHLYNNDNLGTESSRYKMIQHLLEDIDAVKGEAGILWHQRVWASDYGWDTTYLYLLEKLLGSGIQTCPTE